MTKKLQHLFALSEKGAEDLVKAVAWCFVCNLSLMLPVGAVLFTVQHLLDSMENGGSSMNGFWIYAGFGIAVLILLFILLIVRGYYIAMHARDRFGALLAAGISTHIALQTFLNIGVVTNFLPATGISLPFFSYGGTALLMQLFEAGVVLAVSRQNDNKLL